MRGSPVQLAAETSIVATIGFWIPIVILGYSNAPPWASLAWLAIGITVLFFLVYRTNTLDLYITKRSTREEWELAVEGIGGYFVVGGVLLALYSIFAVSRTACAQPPTVGVNDPSCVATQTTSYIPQGSNNLIASLGPLSYYEILVGLLFLIIFLPMLLYFSVRYSRLSEPSDYYP